MNSLDIILITAAAIAAIGIVSVLTWLLYTSYLNRLEHRLAVRKGFYRDTVAGMAASERALLEPVLHQVSTYRDFEALEAVLEEQARGATGRPVWLLDTYDRLGLVDKYIARLREARRWRERAFAAELLGRVGNAKAVGPLLETVQATRAEDADVREIALRALARIGDPRAVPPLAETLRRAEVWLAPRIADILARHGEVVVDPMIEFLDERSQHPARAWAANILGEVGAVRAFPALVRALDDLDDEVRAKAATALGKLRDQRAVTYLLDHLLADPAPFVRARIAGALGRFNDPEVIDTLVRALGDPAWWVRMRSVEALEQIGAVAEAPLMLALDDTDPEIRIRAAVALERLGVPNRLIDQIESGTAAPEVAEVLTKFGLAGARELLAEQLQHPSARVRQAVIGAIQRAGRRDLAPELAQVARGDAEAELRALAFDTLRHLGAVEAVPAGLEGLGDVHQDVRTAAMRLVGDLGEAEVADMIRPRTTDKEPVVRAAAARALGQLHARDTQPELARLLKDPVPEVRVAATDGVADSEGRWAVPELVRLLGDADPQVRRGAARSLGRLGDRSAVPALLRTFQTGTAELREVVADAVARLDPSALPGLLDVLIAAGDRESRLGVARILSGMETSASLDLLEIVWRDQSPEVRALTVDGLIRSRTDRAAALLGQGLRDPDPGVRGRVADALARLGRAEFGADLLALLADDPVAAVRERAALAVGLLQLPGGEAALIHACRADQPLPVRAAAALAVGVYDRESIVAQVLGMVDEEPVREQLRRCLREDPGYRVVRERLREARQIELRALGSLSRDQMEASLVEGMRSVLDPAERVRLIGALHAFQGERSRRALVYALRNDPDPQVRAAALTAVGGMLDTSELLMTARRAVSDPHPAVRRVAVTLFAQVSPEQALPALLRVVHPDDEDPVLLQTIAAHADESFNTFVDLTLGLARSGREGLIVVRVARYIHHAGLRDLLPQLARSAVPEVREGLARLWSLRPELAERETLARLASDPVTAVRRETVRALALARHSTVLRTLADDPATEVRLELARALHATDDAALLDRLRRDPVDAVRAAAWYSHLRRGGSPQPPDDLARPVLAAEVADTAVLADLVRVARSDPDPDRRRAAGIALVLLDDPAAGQVAAEDPVPAVRDVIRRWLEEGPAA